jgi:hypothetical protein
VESGAVIEGFDVIEDGGARLGAGGKAAMIDQLIFESAPEGFDEGVIIAVALAALGSDQAVLGQDLPISCAVSLGTVGNVWDIVGFGRFQRRR